MNLRPSSGETPPVPPDIGLHTTLRALGLRVIRDTRPNQGLGSKYSFQPYRFTFNKYTSLKRNQVLAYNLFGCFTGGAPPFYGNCIYGANNELRGYTAGQYIDRNMFATQLEYRLVLRKRIGLRRFAGVGEVAPGASQLFRVEKFLPDFGAGPRYELGRKYHINLRADDAKGKNTGAGAWG